MSQNFVNSTSRLRRMTFVVNFDISSVICQVTPNSDDLRIFPISILCDGKQDCLQSPGMDDESFPYCCIWFHYTCSWPCFSPIFPATKCAFKCGANGACLMDGGKSLCYCNEGFGGKGCDKPSKYDYIGWLIVLLSTFWLIAVSECSNKPCHWLARCTNTFDSHYCTCLPGFEGDGYNCTGQFNKTLPPNFVTVKPSNYFSDIDECTSNSQPPKCPKYAKCCNIPGSHFCNCTEGFIPKGVPLVECVGMTKCPVKNWNRKETWDSCRHWRMCDWAGLVSCKHNLCQLARFIWMFVEILCCRTWTSWWQMPGWSV